MSNYVSVLVFVLGLFAHHCDSSADTWVVLVAASRYWFNYRHLANVLAVYKIVKEHGVSDSNIILMNGFDDICGTRNPFPGLVYADTKARIDICKNVQSDYRGADVTVDAFLRLLSGRHHLGTPVSKRLLSNNDSNILIYLSGHGGDGFFKFRDTEEVSSDEIGSAVAEMELKQRYRRIMLISDTCQAATLDDKITARNVISLASSGASQNSYAYSANPKLGVSLIDRFSFSLAEFFRLRVPSKKDLKKQTVEDLIGFFDPKFLMSTPALAMTAGFTDPSKIKLSWFFGSVDSSSTSYIVPPNARIDDAGAAGPVLSMWTVIDNENTIMKSMDTMSTSNSCAIDRNIEQIDVSSIVDSHKVFFISWIAHEIPLFCVFLLFTFCLIFIAPSADSVA